MTAPLFDPDKCDNIGSVPSLDFDFVSDCSIAAPPPPIFDCTLPIVPPDVPVPCPEFEGSVHIRTGYGTCGSISEAQGALTITRTDNAACRFLIDLDLDIPIPPPPCPDINGGSFGVEVGIAHRGCPITGPTGSIRVTKVERPFNCNSSSSDAAACEFTIDLDLAIPLPPVPCPGLEGGSVNLNVGFDDCVTEPRGELRVTKDIFPGNCSEYDSCRFTIDLDLDIPIPKPVCPDITGGSVTLTTGFADCVGPAGGAITIHKSETAGDCNTPPTCSFLIDLDLNVPVPRPPCPKIEGGSVDLNVGYAACVPTAGGTITVNKEDTPGTCSTAGSCQFTIDLALDIPIPEPQCPVITATGSLTYSPLVSKPTLMFTVESIVTPGNCSEPDQCAFDFNLDLELPIPGCPVITGTLNAYLTGPGDVTGTFEVIPKSETEGVCEFELAIDLAIPKQPCPEITGVVLVYTATEATGTLEVNQTTGPEGECKFDLDLQIAIPKPLCPEITGVVTVYEASAATGTLEVNQTTGPEGECQFDLDLQLGIPPVLCPVVTGTVQLTPTAPNAITGTINTTTATGPDGACEISLEFDLKVPEQSCPEVTGVISVYEATSATGTFETTKETGPNGECALNMQLGIGLPKYIKELQTGAVTCAYTNCDADPTLDVSFDAPDENGVVKMNFDLRLPTPEKFVGGAITLGDYGTGKILLTGECTERTIGGSISLNTTSCDDSGGSISQPDGSGY